MHIYNATCLQAHDIDPKLLAIDNVDLTRIMRKGSVSVYIY